jgi:vacuolar-type H+-ATPase subunit I/STV1
LNTLPNESIGSWGELESEFARNFRSTYKRPASLEEVKAYVQRKGEALRSYIQRWSVIKNSAEDVSDERAIDALSAGLRRSDLVEEIGRTRPTTVAELMEEANKLADEEDTYNNMERTHIITKEDGHQKSTEQVGKGDDTVAGIIKKGETR